ncbi:MAG: fructosamine kinase family protein [Akkermansiaceae bacterium]|nr:fructosamine kinase family protein [Akkermansiaceae bacterium]NNM29927.1 fructosamine kinase family protein [Akkermansiaceae bacterium]
MMDLTAIRSAIRTATGSCPDGPPEPVAGGCINDAFRLGDTFVKTNHPAKHAMFAAEELGLRAIEESGTVRVPAVLASGTTADCAFLVLEFLPLAGSTRASQEDLGRRLAAMHRVTSGAFGWSDPNFIGATPQPNPRTASWVEFYRDHRLRHMLELATARGFAFTGTADLLDAVGGFFPAGEPVPSLLHGDLWGGNASALADGTPVVFDPAAYFGDREADLAMTALFGGFGPEFYAAYDEAWPRDDGHHQRQMLYNLYHILNHAVLFGGGYAAQAQRMIDSLLAIR